jgi:hypothetical protein
MHYLSNFVVTIVVGVLITAVASATLQYYALSQSAAAKKAFLAATISDIQPLQMVKH